MIDKGLEAQKLLDNPLFEEALTKAKSQAVKEFVDSDFGESDKREHQYLFLKAIYKVEGVIKGFIKEGERETLKSGKKPPPPLHNLNE